MLKVCILSSVHNVFDTRIFLKEAMTLAKAGYEVVFIVQHDRAEVVDGVRIVPLPKPRNRFERMFWLIWKTFWLGLREKASVYHFHDPELIPAGLFLKLFSKKVIYDIHELVYFQIKNKYWIRNMIILQIAQNAYLFFEKMAVKYFDALIIAEDGYFDYFKSRYGDLKKLITVRNYPVIGAIENAISIPKKTDKAIIIYAGNERSQKIRF